MDWIPALSTSGLLGIAISLSLYLILTRLKESVAHEFNTKLEELRTDLRLKENEIASLRSGALTALTSRQTAMDKRRLEAADQLWAAFNALAPLKGAAITMSVIKFDVASKRVPSEPKLRDFFKVMADQIDISKIRTDKALKARPHVSPLAWAYFSAYQAVVWSSMAKLNVLKAGLDAPDLIDNAKVAELIKAALPHQSEYVDKVDPAGYAHLLEELEASLLLEIRRTLEGREADAAGIAHAAEIIRNSNAVMASAEMASKPKEAEIPGELRQG